MSRKDRSRDKLPPFVPLFRETLATPAYRELSFGARALFTALRARCFRNNGRVYLSHRDAGEEMGHGSRNQIANWYRELAHYGFIVQTEAASLGVDGKGKATHWRITDLPARKGNNELEPPTKDFLQWDGVVFEPHVAPARRWNEGKRAELKKQNPGLHVGATVDYTLVPEVDCTFVPPSDGTGTDVQPISARCTGADVQPITRLATRCAYSETKKHGGAA